MEFETVKEALQYLHDISQYTGITVDNKPATVKDIQEFVFEATTSIADLLGLSEIYLGGDSNK